MYGISLHTFKTAKCPTPLGMKRGRPTLYLGSVVPSGVLDEQLTASSWLEEQFHPRNSRYDSNSCWKSDDRDLHSWIQVDFQERHIITGLVVQGCNQDSLGWIQIFKVESRTTLNQFVTHVDKTTGSEVTGRFNGSVVETCRALDSIQ